MTLKQNKTVLLIEDDPFQVDMYKMEFEDYGYNIICAKNGQDGLKFAKEQRPDIILLDLVMDDMDGFEVLTRLKKDVGIKNIPVIILTNLAKKASEEKSMSMGAVAFIRKTRLMPRHVVGMVRAKLDEEELKSKKIKPKKEKILLAEDDEFQREMYNTKFAMAGYKLILAVNGEEAIDLAKKNIPDLVLLDLALPVKSGYEALKELKSDSATKNIPVIAFTVSAQGEIPKEAREYILKNTVDYIQKTVHTPQEALDRVEKIFKKSAK